MTVIQMPNPKYRTPEPKKIHMRTAKTLAGLTLMFVSAAAVMLYGEKKIAPEREAARKAEYQRRVQMMASDALTRERYDFTRKELINFENARISYLSTKESYDMDEPLRNAPILNSLLAHDIKETEDKFLRTRAQFLAAASLTRIVLEAFCTTEGQPVCDSTARPITELSAMANLGMVRAAEDLLKKEDAVEAAKLLKRPVQISSNKAAENSNR